MDLSQLPVLIMLVLVSVTGAGGLWYFGIRTGSRLLKHLAVMLGALPVVVIGAEVASFYELFRPTEFRFGAVFQPDVPAGAWQDGPLFHLDEEQAERRHELEITVEVWGGNPPKGPIEFGVSVVGPDGNVVAEERLSTSPAPGKLKWLPVKMQFQPRGRG